MMETRLQVVLILSALVSGAANTLGFTLQNKQPVIEGNVHKHFFHPYMQVAMRFVSNLISLAIYFILKLKKGQVPSEQTRQQETKKVPLLLYLIPTLLDYVAVLCYYTALNFIPGSVYQILRGGTILTTFLFSYTCLKARPTRAKITGCLIAFGGLIVVGLVNLLMGNESNEQRQQTLIGYGLIFIALFGNGLHFVYEQYLIVRYSAKPLVIVGMEGLFGVLISLVFIPVLSLIPCQLGSQICVLGQSGEAVVQNFSIYLNEVSKNGLILTGVIIVMISMCAYNSLGVTIAKYMNSLTRAICDASRTVIIWVVGIVVTVGMGGDDKAFRWESLNPWQIVGQSLGFIVLIIGNLVYYQVIKFSKGSVKRSILMEEQNQSVITICQQN